MDFSAILKKSWFYASKMHYLWGVGLLVALTEGVGWGYGSGYNFPSQDNNLKEIIPNKMEELPDTLTKGFDNFPRVLGSQNGSEVLAGIVSFLQHNWLAIIISIIVLLLVWLAIVLVSYCAKAGLIEEIDNLEKSKGSGSFSSVFSLGKKSYLSLLLFDIFIGLLIGVVIVLLGMLISGGISSGSSSAIASVFVIGLIGLLLLIPVVFYLTMVSELARRLIVLERLRIMEAFNRAREIIKQQFGNVLITLLISVAVNILRGVIVSIISLIIFVPAILILISAITKSSTGVHDYMSFIITFIVSLIVVLLINWIISAFFAVFLYSYWNLSYKAIVYLANNKSLSSAK